MKVYTRSGDGGRTGLFGGRRVAKSHPRVKAYGIVDELNALLGLAHLAIEDPELAARIGEIQGRLFDLGADLATPLDSKAGAWLQRVPLEWVTSLEQEIDAMEAELPALASFILPGGSPAAAWLHLARTVCRRAERRTVEAVDAGEDLSPSVIAYLNRLSDWLFTAARLANQRAGIPDRIWQAARSEAGQDPSLPS